MSGGSLDYWNANDPIREIKKRLMFGKGIYKPETLKLMQETIKVLRKAETYSHRLEWFFSGDDGEENLQERLAEDLKELETEKEIPVFAPHCKYCEQFRDGTCFYDKDFWCYRDKKSMYERFKDDATECFSFEPSSKAIWEIEHPGEVNE